MPQKISSQSTYTDQVKGRIFIIKATLLFCFCLMAARAFWVHTSGNHKTILQKLADRQYFQKENLTPYRGSLLDHRGEPLAISVLKSSFYINPKTAEFKPSEIEKIAKILGLNKEEMKNHLKKNTYFHWLKRHCDDDTSKKILALNHSHIFEIKEQSRYYPDEQMASQLIGYVGRDGKGLFGIEKQFDKDLRGRENLLILSRDAKRRMILDDELLVLPEKSGQDVYLTLDRAIQSFTEEALAKGIANADAIGGLAIVADPFTGKILAMVNQPAFNPNAGRLPDLTQTKNYALTGLFEPGSVIKPLIVAGALERGKATLQQRFVHERGEIQIGRHRIRDSHRIDQDDLALSEVVIHSSNIGMYKLGKLIGAETVFNILSSFGFTSSFVLTGFPGEAQSRISDWKKWPEVKLANITFGQGMMIQPMALVQAYGAIANGGDLMKPLYLDKIKSANGEELNFSSQRIQKVLSKEVAQKTRDLLEQTVNQATKEAGSKLYRTAGKTGTSQKIDEKTGRYSREKHLSSFIGFAPADKPRIVVYVLIDEPNQKQSYGSIWAAPVFREIVDSTLKYFNVKPQIKEKTLAKQE